jgi:hypothetical protein
MKVASMAHVFGKQYEREYCAGRSQTERSTSGTNRGISKRIREREDAVLIKYKKSRISS